MSKDTFRGGTHPNDEKLLSRDQDFIHYLPKGEMVYPCGQHIGKPAKPIVKKGDQVLAGQLLAEADGFVSANVISSCSGTVKAVEPRQTAAGVTSMSIVVTNDGEYRQVEGIGTYTDYTTLTTAEILAKVKAAGIVGLGGAGFPTHVKLAPKNPAGIFNYILNGAECEPYITCDDRLMRAYADEIVKGLEIGLFLFPNAKGTIVIEKNKPEAIAAMETAIGASPMKDRICLLAAKTKYPQGGERQLISLVTGIHYPAANLPSDVGCIVSNVGTMRAVYRAVCYNEPLMEKGITVSGAVNNPVNLMTRIGLPFSELLEAAGGFSGDPKKLICGGPMMGVSLANLDVPVQKAFNALTVLEEDGAEAPMTACIRCGRCVDVCPLGLNPQLMAEAAKKQDYARYEKLCGTECIGCGTCTYVCPAKRPLMQTFKMTKAEILLARRKKQEAK